MTAYLSAQFVTHGEFEFFEFPRKGDVMTVPDVIGRPWVFRPRASPLFFYSSVWLPPSMFAYLCIPGMPRQSDL